jgi:imidazolonepropionase-like amidohydrolase
MKERILLKSGNLLDTTSGTIKTNLDVLIQDAIIKEVGKVEPIDEASLTQIDCTKRYLLPGLFDCHTHLSVLTNQDEETQKEILQECGVEKTNHAIELEEYVLKDFVAKGITQVRDVGGPLNTLRSLKDEISVGTYIGPDLFYAGPMLQKGPLTGDQMNKRWPGWNVAVNSIRDARGIVQLLSKEGASLVKAFRGFNPTVLKCLINEAQKVNLPVTHDPGPTFFHTVPMDVGIELGIKCFEHGKTPWYVVLKDSLKSEHDSLMNADQESKQAFIARVMSAGVESISMTKLRQLIDMMIENNVWFCPTLHVFKFYSEKPEVFNEDEPDKYGKIFKRLYEVSRVITSEVAKRKVRILVGQDGYIPRFTLNEMQLLKEIGLSEPEIIKGATIYPAEWLEITDQLGSISPNKKANILILNKNPLEDIQNIMTTHAVLQNGKIVFQE